MTNIIATTKAASPDGTMSAELYRELQRMGRATTAAEAAAAANAADLTTFKGTGDWGAVLYKGETDWAWLAPGTAGQVLQSNGADADPEWASGQAYTLLTSQATTSGTAFDFVIPSAANRITVMWNGVSLSGTDNFLIQLGTSGGFVSSGYESASASVYSTAGFIALAATAATLYTGQMFINRFSGNIWNSSHQATGIAGGSGATRSGAGFINLGAAVTQLRFTRTGTNTFDAGAVNVAWE